eukprot:6910783-Prymnesium_polylepis.2
MTSTGLRASVCVCVLTSTAPRAGVFVYGGRGASTWHRYAAGRRAPTLRVAQTLRELGHRLALGRRLCLHTCQTRGTSTRDRVSSDAVVDALES